MEEWIDKMNRALASSPFTAARVREIVAAEQAEALEDADDAQMLAWARHQHINYCGNVATAFAHGYRAAVPPAADQCEKGGA